MFCELCKRSENVILDKHHKIPKTLHSNKWYKKNFSDEQLNETLLVCRDCHDAIHKFIDEKSLGREYNTKEKLLTNDKLIVFVKWISTKKHQFSKAHKA